MRWTDARKSVDSMVANGTPIKLSDKELDAVYAIARTAQSVIYSVEIERLTAAFRRKERKVNRELVNYPRPKGRELVRLPLFPPGD